MNLDMTGKVAFVTGGGSGIGEAACRVLAEAGASVVAVGRRVEAVEAVAASLRGAGLSVLAIAADVADESALASAMDETIERFGGLDVVCANAGFNGMLTPIDEMTLDEWRATLDTNLTGTFLTVKHAIPALRARGGGAVVVTSSINGTRMFSGAGYAAYSTAKAGQVAFVKMAAIEVARWNIRVNAVLPGGVSTSIGERTQERNRERVDWNVPRPDRWPPLRGRPAEPAEIADLMLFLASDAGRHITGAEVVIDAGHSLLRG